MKCVTFYLYLKSINIIYEIYKINNLKPEQINEDKKSNKDPDISKIKNDIFPYGGFDLISSDKSENSKKPKND